MHSCRGQERLHEQMVFGRLHEQMVFGRYTTVSQVERGVGRGGSPRGRICMITTRGAEKGMSSEQVNHLR